METRLHELEIHQKNSRPNHPTTCGKVERLPKTWPAGPNTGPHYRIRHDRIDKTGAVSLRRGGRMHHIGIGPAHKHNAVALLIDDLDIRVINTDTEELLRQLKLNSHIGYQPRFKK